MAEYSVVHCGIGYVGKMALRLLRQQPGLKLVGHYVSSPEKAGKDSGELVSLEPDGVLTTNSWDEAVALKADVLTYFADGLPRERQAIEDVIPFLENGTNVVTAWELEHRRMVPPDLMERIAAACRKGRSSCFFTSVDPGWVTSDLAIAALAQANRIDSVRLIEFGDFTNYTAEYASREYFGFGQPLGFRPTMVRDDLIKQMGAPTLYRLADVLEVEIHELKPVYETDCVDYDIETGFGIVKAGTASAVRFELQALSRGRPFLFLEHINYVLKDLGHCTKPWSKPNAPTTAYRIEVHGDPKYDLELQCAQPSQWCATPVINCIPAVVAAPPGLVRPRDVPRSWSRNVTARLGRWP